MSGYCCSLLVLECADLQRYRKQFSSPSNAFEITRLSVEIGLLALAMTPVIITGGIDLSVGSMMGLAAVVLGASVARCSFADGVGGLLALAGWLLGGALNALDDHAAQLPAVDCDTRHVFIVSRYC